MEEQKEKDTFKGDLLPPGMVKFIGEHHLLTLAASDGDDLWCSHAFYVYLEDENAFLITSEERTRHIRLSLKEGVVAGAIGLETKRVGEIRGIQFRASIEHCSDSIFGAYKLKYLKQYPYAIFKGGDLWLLKLTEAKYTDNRLGFGKKIKWSV